MWLEEAEAKAAPFRPSSDREEAEAKAAPFRPSSDNEEAEAKAASFRPSSDNEEAEANGSGEPASLDLLHGTLAPMRRSRCSCCGLGVAPGDTCIGLYCGGIWGVCAPWSSGCEESVLRVGWTMCNEESVLGMPRRYKEGRRRGVARRGAYNTKIS